MTDCSCVRRHGSASGGRIPDRQQQQQAVAVSCVNCPKVVTGIHFAVFEGILDAPPDLNAYAVVEVWRNKAAVCAFGVGSSRELLFE